MEATNTRINKYIDDDLIGKYQESVEHFGNNDLVLVIKEDENNNLVNAYERKPLLNKPDIHHFLLNKLRKPAKEVSGILSHSEIAFWLMVFYSNGESDCVAVKTTLLAPGGHA